MIKTLPYLMIYLVLMTSCAQISSFQTARTTAKSEGEFGASLNIAGVSGGFDDENYAFPTIELWGRYGVGSKTDIGLKISSGLTFLFDVKQQLVGDQQSKFAFAIGGAAGAFPAGVLVYQFHVPMYLSYHPSEKIAWYLTPRYVFQGISGEGSANYMGSSLGVLFGRKVKFGIDLSYNGVLGEVIGLEDSYIGARFFNIGFGVKIPIR